MRRPKKHSTKVKKFIECIESVVYDSGYDGEWSGKTANEASALAHKKYKLNAAWYEDQDAWWEAVAATIKR